MTVKPLLTISIPTFNRSAKLTIMLEALIPQAIRCGEELEIIINDNGSTDDTREVIKKFSQEFPLTYIYNGVNLGGILNIILSGNRANGEYVWILGDDDIVVPDRVPEILETIRQHQNYEIFVLNTRGADFQQHWPVSAVGGYSGDYIYLLNEKLEDAEYATWEESLLPTNGFGTQIYISIVRSKYWKEYWGKRTIYLAPTDEHEIFPHSIFVASTFKDKPCYYLGKPALTTFDGAQCWSSVAVWIILDKVPNLLDIYRQKGVSGKRISEIRKFVYYSWCAATLEDNFRQGKLIYPTWMFLKSKWFSPLAWSAWLFVLVKIMLLKKETKVISWSALLIEFCRRILPESLFNSLKGMVRKSH